jgi:hypothetical protein
MQSATANQPNNPLELTAHSAGFMGHAWRFLLWAAAQRERSAQIPPEWKGGTPATVVMSKIAFAFPLRPATPGSQAKFSRTMIGATALGRRAAKKGERYAHS